MTTEHILVPVEDLRLIADKLSDAVIAAFERDKDRTFDVLDAPDDAEATITVTPAIYRALYRLIMGRQGKPAHRPNEQTPSPMTTDLKKLAEAAKKATPQNFDTAQSKDSEVYGCPLCDGEGEVEADTYTNYDGVPIGVRFFGIGQEHIDAEAYYRAANPKAILSLISSIETLQQEVETLRGRLTNHSNVSAHPQACPITRRPFFMVIEHPELGDVATYGGPFDSYTIPAVDDDGELRCERYDHDRGDWIEGGEPTCLYIVTEEQAVSVARARQEAQRDCGCHKCLEALNAERT